MSQNVFYIDDVWEWKLSMWFEHISSRYVSYQVLAKKKKSDVLDAKTHEENLVMINRDSIVDWVKRDVLFLFMSFLYSQVERAFHPSIVSCFDL